ncbi:MAG: TIGR02300 family protein [Alphaproteobacteria bacterium]|nr:TIGR02300 family protein [Alphaproteobacteria bacterium]
MGRSEVAKAEWGMKRLCPGCGARYYDMKKNPPVCPTCKTPFDPENLVRAKRGRSTDKKAKDAAEDVIDDLPVADGETAEDAVIEDAEELGDDAVDEVVVGEEEA